MKNLLFGLAILCLAVPGFCQQNDPPHIRPLSIGDAMPDIKFTNLINYHSKTARLSDFKGKLVILDFWATWCGSCIAQFRHLDALQAKYKNDFQLILVNSWTTNDTKEKIVSLFNRRAKENGQQYKFLVSIRDSTLEELFPHATVPHYVWISPNGDVIGITSSRQITDNNIEQAIKGNNIDMPHKKDFDLTKPLFLNPQFNPNQLSHYSTLLRGRIEGLPNRFSIRQFEPAKHELTITNTPIFLIYQKIATELIPGFSNKQMIINVQDSSELILDREKFNSLNKYEKNIYTYEIISSGSYRILYNSVLTDFNRYTNYYGRVEKRKMKILSLIRTSTKDRIITKGGVRENRLEKTEERYLKNAPISVLVSYLNRRFSQLVIDNTGYTNAIDFYLPKDTLIDSNTLLVALRNHGLDLIQTEKEIEVFILTEKAKSIN